MSLPPHLQAAYRAAPYRAAGQDFAIGRRSRALDALLRGLGRREAALVTACNPASRRRPEAWNARAMERLRTRLHGLPVLPAESGTGAWREPQLLVGAPAARVAAIGRRFGQHALVRLRRGTPPRLMSLR